MRPRGHRSAAISAAAVPYRLKPSGVPNPVLPRVGAIATTDGELTGTPATIIVYVVPRGKSMKAFTRFLHATNCLAEDLGDGAWMVSGGRFNIETLKEHSCVREWHYVIEGGRVSRSSGTGTTKPSSKGNKPKGKPLGSPPAWWTHYTGQKGEYSPKE